MEEKETNSEYTHDEERLSVISSAWSRMYTTREKTANICAFVFCWSFHSFYFISFRQYIFSKRIYRNTMIFTDDDRIHDVQSNRTTILFFIDNSHRHFSVVRKFRRKIPNELLDLPVHVDDIKWIFERKMYENDWKVKTLKCPEFHIHTHLIV